jgi:hypothetical protein
MTAYAADDLRDSIFGCLFWPEALVRPWEWALSQPFSMSLSWRGPREDPQEGTLLARHRVDEKMMSAIPQYDKDDYIVGYCRTCAAWGNLA